MVGMPRRRVVRTAAAPKISEKQFQSQVERYARLNKWLVYHTWRSIHSAKGFPDLIMIRGGRVVVAELKTLTGKLSPYQSEWLDAWAEVPGNTVKIWRPTDEDWQDIERTLGRAA